MTEVFFLKGEWLVMWQGRLCSPGWSDRGGALAYLSMLRNGMRKPEYSKEV